MNRKDEVKIGNMVSVVYFLTNHQASILKGQIHDIMEQTDAPYIVVMAPDTSTHQIYLDDIRTLRRDDGRL